MFVIGLTGIGSLGRVLRIEESYLPISPVIQYRTIVIVLWELSVTTLTFP
jgi:hypothetical protein